jgi:hypothetical protein
MEVGAGEGGAMGMGSGGGALVVSGPTDDAEGGVCAACVVLSADPFLPIKGILSHACSSTVHAVIVASARQFIAPLLV